MVLKSEMWAPTKSMADQTSYLPPIDTSVVRIPTRILLRVSYFISQLRMIVRGAIQWNLQTLRYQYLDRVALD